MKDYPFHVIAGLGKGYSYSSFTQIQDLLPAKSLGQAEINVFYNVASLNTVVRDHALTFAEINGSVTLGYLFNSQSVPISSAWRLPIKSFTPPTSDAKQILFVEEDGHETTYQWDGMGYRPPGLMDGTPYLQWNESTNQWYWYHPGTQVTEIYNSQGLLLQRRDRWGNKTNYGYDKNQLNTVTGPSGNQYRINRTVNVDGTRYETITLAKSGSELVLQSYQFDKNGLLIESITSTNGTNLTSGYKTTYNYYRTSPTAQIDTIIQDDGVNLEFAYTTLPSSGEIALQTIYLSQGKTRADFTYSGQKIGLEIRGGLKIDMLLDSQSRLNQLNQYTGFSGSKTYDTTQYQYASTGQIAAIISPDKSQETFAYDSTFGLLQQHCHPNGQQTDYYYDIGQNRPILQSKISTLEESKQQAITYYVQQRQTNHSSDPADETVYLLYEIDPERGVKAYEPTPQGPPKNERCYLVGKYDEEHKDPKEAPSVDEMQSWQKQQDPQQVNLTEFAYDIHGLLYQTKKYATVDKTGAGVADDQMSMMQRYWTDYGQWYRSIQKVDEDESGMPIEAETDRRFDGLQRLTSVMDAEDNLTQYSYNPINDDKTYPGAKYVQTITQPNGRIEASILDQQGDEIFKNVTATTTQGALSSQLTTLQRDSAGRPTIIKHADGTFTYQVFDQQNRQRLRISTTGLVIEHQYDEIHNYECDISYENPIDTSLIKSPNIDGDEIKEAIKLSPNDRYQYRFYDASHRLRFIVDAKNQAVEYQYDSLDRRTAVIRYAQQLTEEQLNTLKSGDLITLAMDLQIDRCDSTYYDLDDNVSGRIDPDGWVTEFFYDGADQSLQQIAYSTPNRSDPRSSNFQDMRPEPAAQDATSYYFRNAQGQIILTVDAEGFITTSNYYPNELVKQTLHYYNKVSSDWYQNTKVPPPLPAPHSEDRTDYYRYDLLNRELSRVASDYVARAQQYTNMGRIALQQSNDDRFTDPTSLADGDRTRTVQTRYDGWENAVKIANPMINQQLALIDADETLSPEEKQARQEEVWNNSSQRDTYDGVTGLKLSMQDTLNRVTRYYYDQERQLVLSISPMGVVTEFIYSSFQEVTSKRRYFQAIRSSDLETLTGGFITDAVSSLLIKDDTYDTVETFTYSKCSEKLSVIDAEGYQSTFEYNAFGEQITECLPTQDQKPTLTISHQFNPRGQEIKTTRQNTSSDKVLTIQRRFENAQKQLTEYTDESGALTQYEHDRLGNEVTVVNALGITSHQRGYDALSRLLFDTNALSETTRYQYDQQHRTHLELPPIPGTQVSTETNVFTEVISKTDGLGSITTQQHAPNGQLIRSTNEMGKAIQDTYDSESQRLSHLDPAQTKTLLTYNDDGYVVSQTQQSSEFKDLTTN
jgi:YD repeat-containing protein